MADREKAGAGVIDRPETGHEQQQENLRELLNHGGTSDNIGTGEAPPGEPSSVSGDVDRGPGGPERETAGGTGGQHGSSLSYGGTGGGSRYGETTGLVGYDIGSGQDPQEQNTPPSPPREGQQTPFHQESGPETSRAKGSSGKG